jgi:hypothetical protein
MVERGRSFHQDQLVPRFADLVEALPAQAVGGRRRQRRRRRLILGLQQNGCPESETAPLWYPLFCRFHLDQP